MGILYIDESGDNGFFPGSTKSFILAGISIDSTQWKKLFWKIKKLRIEITKKYGLVFNELKGSAIFTHRGPFFNSLVTSRKEQYWIFNKHIELLCDSSVTLFALEVSKPQFEKRQQQAKRKNIVKLFNNWIWTEFLSIYENYLTIRSKELKTKNTALVYSDTNSSQEKYIRKIIRSFSARYDEDDSIAGAGIIEDIVFRDSKTSYFIQLADILAFKLNLLFWGGGGRKDMIAITEETSKRILNKLNQSGCYSRLK